MTTTKDREAAIAAVKREYGSEYAYMIETVIGRYETEMAKRREDGEWRLVPVEPDANMVLAAAEAARFPKPNTAVERQMIVAAIAAAPAHRREDGIRCWHVRAENGFISGRMKVVFTESEADYWRNMKNAEVTPSLLLPLPDAKEERG